MDNQLWVRGMKDQTEGPADSETYNVASKVLGLIWRQDHDDCVQLAASARCFEKEGEY